MKTRLSSAFPRSEVLDALGQAKAFAKLLSQLATEREPLSAWRFAFQHLLLSLIGFGMRVYSQHPDLGGQAGEWAKFHEQIATAILSDDGCVTVNKRGRLIVVDRNLASGPHDNDGDRFDETIIINLEDAGRIVGGDAQVFYEKVREKIRDWQLKPRSGAGETKSDGPDGPGDGPSQPGGSGDGSGLNHAAADNQSRKATRVNL